jgi:hypothetical protein
MVQLTTDSLGDTTLDGYYVFPAQYEQSLGSFREFPFMIDETLYHQNVYDPANAAGHGRPAIFRHIRTANLSYCPIAFNPVMHRLRALKEIVLHAEFSGLDTVNILPSWPASVPPLYSNMYRSSILNYGTLGIPDDPPAPTKYLIIADTCFRTALDSLIAWKRQKGDSVLVSWTPDPKCAHDIHESITWYYQHDSIDYVLLVGAGLRVADSMARLSGPLLPFYRWVQDLNDSGYYAYSDVWYSLVAGGDDIPDVALGRFSVWTPAQLRTVTDKLFSYERYPDDTTPCGIKWHDLVSSRDLNSGSTFDSVKLDSCAPVLGPSGFQYYEDYAGKPGEANQDVINHIDGQIAGHGVSLVNYYGHGDSTDWEWGAMGDSSFSNADINSLTNFTDAHHGRLPIVFEIACNCAHAGDSDGTTCHSECWLQSSTGGAVAALGATELMLTLGGTAEFDAQLYRVAFDNTTGTAATPGLGWVVNQAKVNMANFCGWLPYALDVIRGFHLMGDPEVEVYTGWGGYLSAIHAGYVVLGGQPYVFPVLVKDVNGNPRPEAFVCLRHDADFCATGYTDDTGAVYLTINPTKPGIASLTVTDHNYGPYQRFLQIVTNTSPPMSNGPVSPVCSFSFDQPLYSPSTREVVLSYQLPLSTSVELSIFDATGKLVKAEGCAGIRGPNHALWDCRDLTGRRVGSGVYYVRLKAARNKAIRKVVVL